MKTYSKLAALVFLIFLLVFHPCSAQTTTPSPDRIQMMCDADNYAMTGAAFPSLPNQFSLRVEANFLESNRTAVFHEYFDGVNDRGKMVFNWNGTVVRVILDYANNEVFVYPDLRSGRECRVFTLSQSNFINFTFGIVRNDDGSLHVGTAKHFLEGISVDSPTRYIGLDTIRGIPVVQWQACFNSDNYSFIADYYFTTDNWSYDTISNPTDYNMTLVKIQVRGQILLNGTVKDFNHVYSIFHFLSGPNSVPDHSFVVPTGLACVGRIPGIDKPQLPQFFSTSIQFLSPNDSQLSTYRIFYDSNHSLFRADYYYEGPYTIIHDFDTQVQYKINRHTGFCNVSSLQYGEPDYYGDIDPSSEASLQLVSPNRLFNIDDRFNYSYEGVSTVRGVEVDSWISIRDLQIWNPRVNLTDAIVEVFFTRPQYMINTVHSSGDSIIPWRFKTRGLVSYLNGSEIIKVNISFQMDLFDFSAGEPPYDVFDTSKCLSSDQVYTLILAIKTSNVGIDFLQFRTNLRSSIIGYIPNLKPLQVNNIHIVTFNDTHIFVSLLLTNLSEVAVDSTDTVTADYAYQMLQKGLRNNQILPFSVKIPGQNTTLFPSLFTSGIGQNVTCNVVNNNSSCKDTENITDRLGLTDGVVTGIAVALFFAGLLVGILLMGGCYLGIKCCGKNGGSANIAASIKYKKHDDEVDANVFS